MRDAGAFDGPLGVLAAVAAVARLRAEDVSLPFSVDVLGFSDEEGLRFGTAYLGSRAVAGTLDPGVLAVADADGVTVGEALAGGRPPRRRAAASGCSATASCTSSRGRCWSERDAPVGVVSAIAGATRAEVRVPRPRRPRRHGADGPAPRRGVRRRGARARGRVGRARRARDSWRRSGG